MTDSPTPVLLAWSGGKDSTLALAELRRDPTLRVEGLLTTVTADYQRISMHGVRLGLLRAQARALDLPLTLVEIPKDASNDSYEDRMRTVLVEAQSRGIHHVAFGDLYLEEVRAYRERMLAQLSITALFPLWSEPTAALARHFIGDGYRAILTCVDTTMIDGAFAGRDYDPDLLEALPAHADPCGEHGEFHTFVHDGPLFESAVPVTRGERVLRDGRFMYQDLE